MKYIKLFEQFTIDTGLVIESQDADINMAKAYIDEKSKGKHCLYFQFMADQTAQKYAKEWGLTADGGRVTLACSNNKAELNSIKKDYLNKISSDSKRVFRQYGIGLMVEALDFTLADIDADEEDIDADFNELAKYNKYVGAKTPNDLYLAGGTQEENEDDFVSKSKAEKLELMMYADNSGYARVQIGTFQGEPAFQISDGQDLFIFVGPKSKNKIK
jgi:hypothetical protein